MAKTQSPHKRFRNAVKFHHGNPNRAMGHRYPAPTKMEQYASNFGGAIVAAALLGRHFMRKT